MKEINRLHILYLVWGIILAFLVSTSIIYHTTQMDMVWSVVAMFGLAIFIYYNFTNFTI